MRRFHRDLHEAAERLGYRDISFDFSRRHPRLVGIDPAGITRRFVIASTPSDRRALRNAVAHMRRVSRAGAMVR